MSTVFAQEAALAEYLDSLVERVGVRRDNSGSIPPIGVDGVIKLTRLAQGNYVLIRVDVACELQPHAGWTIKLTLEGGVDKTCRPYSQTVRLHKHGVIALPSGERVFRLSRFICPGTRRNMRIVSAELVETVKKLRAEANGRARLYYP